MPVRLTGDEPEEALDLVRRKHRLEEKCGSVDFGRASSLDACGSVVAKDEMTVKLSRQIGDVPCKGTELLVTARSRILFPIGRLALFEGGGAAGVASHSWIPARQEAPLRN
ncbi:hypothetical protein ABIB00_007608 [Bradyrhizobium sp. LB14.3]|uniref:hypothetical protein n=1 Tax=Bradyrhizobium sp. LB14.3 TaxID=3156328 RepID=UPI003394C130